MALDLVCGMVVDEKSAPAKASFQGTNYYFCADYCKEAFAKDPQKFIDGAQEWGEAKDPVCGMAVKIPQAGAMTFIRESSSIFAARPVKINLRLRRKNF